MKTKIIHARVTEIEMDFIEERMAGRGFKQVTQYIRFLILKDRVIVASALAKERLEKKLAQ